MARYSTLGDYRFDETQEAADDIRGAGVYSSAGGELGKKLGKIDDVVFDSATGAIIYVVIDTGGWLSSKKFIVPPKYLIPSSKHDRDYIITISKDQIESFPAFDSKDISSDERWADYEERYRAKWEQSPVMHRAGSDRNLTPEAQRQSDEASHDSLNQRTTEPDDVINETALDPMKTDATMDYDASGPSLRWTTFEDRIRQRREEVLNASIRNVEKAEADKLRKAG